ncbi:MAG: XdhC family protein [Gammaproteobacteria bacterium]|nr:XdhC family protein [Gammaproteobacteria bacterium]
MQGYATDQGILQTALDWLKQGHDVALVTVLKTWGSSPRPLGSLMIMRRDGIHAGSVSGGCVEDDLVKRYRDQHLSDSNPTRVDYGVNRDDATRFGLPCGGRLELLVERLNDHQQLEQLLTALQQQQLIARHLDLQTGRVTLQTASVADHFIYTHSYVRKIFGAQWTMLLIGAGHVSHYVSQMALLLNYRVIICDPRDEYAQPWNVEGTELSALMPDDAVKSFVQQPCSIVVALTHDPKLDDMALMAALDSPAFYVGAIGSRRNCELRRKRLKQLGLTPSQLQRLHAPTGLAIGSHTPAEIAVSILAEITQQRNAVTHSIKQSVSLV